MQLNVDQFNERVNFLLAEAQQKFPLINARLAVSALSLVRNRIINDGKDHTGKSFGSYSQNNLPFFYFTNKGLGSGADAKLASAKKRNPKGISYAEFRRINGLQTDHVDLKFTGETLRDFSVLETRSHGNIIETVVASKNSITKKQYRANGSTYESITTGKVAEHLQEKYGDFMRLSNKEEEILEEALDDEVQQLLDEVFT